MLLKENLFRTSDSTLQWLRIGVIALGLAGIHSIILVVLRTPQLSHLIKNPYIFKASLVVHVNLSVLAWLMAIVAAIWSLETKYRNLNRICSNLALLGLVMIFISPFGKENLPIMNNYIPMLESTIFVIGLSLFGVALLLFAISTAISSGIFHFLHPDNSELYIRKIIRFTISSSSLMFLLVWICFVSSYFELEILTNMIALDINHYYELLYWSGGHLLQFIYTQILIVVWLTISIRLTNKEIKFQRLYYYILILNFAFSLAGLLGHYCYDIASTEFKLYYTNHMKYVAGIAPTLALIIILYNFCRAKNKEEPLDYLKATIISSITLFIYGGVLGAIISGTNTTIPAHYHGSIVGISIGFMGISYLWSNLDIKDHKKAAFQIYIITFGQILHISGLAIAGGYGVLRKTSSLEEYIMQNKIKLALGTMGGGGIIAIIGGLMFVFICGRSYSLIVGIKLHKPSKEEAKEAIRTLLKFIGEDPDREGLKNTPERVINSYGEMFDGYNQNIDEVLNTRFYNSCNFQDIILLRDIKFNSFCEHHLLPVVGNAQIAYIPNGSIVGISKIARVVKIFAKDLQIQEKMTVQIAEALQNGLNPVGVAVKISAMHSCMTIRGVLQENSVMDTIHCTGIFADQANHRQEFLNLTLKRN